MAINNVLNKIITPTPTANAIAQFDANSNLSANNTLNGFLSTASAAGTTTLTVASAQYQKITGTTTQTVVLPNATTLVNGHTFIINNQSTGNVTVQNNTPATLFVLGANQVVKFMLIDNGSAAGVWQMGDAVLTVNIQRFVTSGASGTYTPSPGMKFIIVEMVGGGGSPGGISVTANQAAGGGGSAGGTYAKFSMTAAQVGASLAYTTGSFGTQSANGTSAGGNGGNSVFGNWTCPGGPGQAAVTALSYQSQVQSTAITVGTGQLINTVISFSGGGSAALVGTVFYVNYGSAGTTPFSGSCSPPAFAITSVGATNGGVFINEGQPNAAWYGSGCRGAGGYSQASASSLSSASGRGVAGAIIVYEYIYA